MQNTLSIQNISPKKDAHPQGEAPLQMVSGPEFATLFQKMPGPGLAGAPTGTGADFVPFNAQEPAFQNTGAASFADAKHVTLKADTLFVSGEPGLEALFPPNPHAKTPQTDATTMVQPPIMVQTNAIDPEKTIGQTPSDPVGTTLDPAQPHVLIAGSSDPVTDIGAKAPILPHGPETLALGQQAKGPEERQSVVGKGPAAADVVGANQGVVDLWAGRDTPEIPGNFDPERRLYPKQDQMLSMGVVNPVEKGLLGKEIVQQSADKTSGVSVESLAQFPPPNRLVGVVNIPGAASPGDVMQAGQRVMPAPLPTPEPVLEPGRSQIQKPITESGQTGVLRQAVAAETLPPSQATTQVQNPQVIPGQNESETVVAVPQFNSGTEPELAAQVLAVGLDKSQQQNPATLARPAVPVDTPLVEKPSADRQGRMSSELRNLPQFPGLAPVHSDRAMQPPLDQKSPADHSQPQALPRDTPPAGPVVSTPQMPLAPDRLVPDQIASERQNTGPETLANPARNPNVPTFADNRLPGQTALQGAMPKDQMPLAAPPKNDVKLQEPRMNGQEGPQNAKNTTPTTLPAEQQLSALVTEVRNLTGRSKDRDKEAGQSILGSSGTLTSELRGHPQSLARHEPALARNIAAQIAQISPPTDNRPVDLTLNPEELGRVRLMFTHDKGHLMISVNAERPETLDLMRRHIETLAQELKGLGYGQVSFGFEQSGNQTPDQNAGNADENGRHDPTLNAGAQGEISEDMPRNNVSHPMRNLAGNIDIRF